MIRYYYFIIEEHEKRYILKCLKNMGVKIQDIANDCKCHQSYIYNMINGIRPVSQVFYNWLVVANIARYLEIHEGGFLSLRYAYNNKHKEIIDKKLLL